MFLLHVGPAGPNWLDWAIEPDVLLLCVALTIAYLYTVYRLRERIPGAGPVERSQVITFLLGVALLYVATGSPMHELAETYLASAHSGLGKVYYSTGDLDQAIQACLRAIALNPFHVEALTNLGNCYLQLSRLEEAEQSLRRLAGADNLRL